MSQPPLNPNLGNPLARLVIALVAVVTMVGTPRAHAVDGSPLDREPPPNDPCALLKISEVQQVFPQAVKMQRYDEADFLGVAGCVWNDAKGEKQLVVTLRYADKGTAESELGFLTLGARDPTRSDTPDLVRYETLTGVADEATAAVERANESKGILQDFAFLVARRGGLFVSVLTDRELPQRDRTAALSALSRLGKTAAQRI